MDPVVQPKRNINTKDQSLRRQESPHPNTATLIDYIQKEDWKTPFLRRLRSINMQWKMEIDSRKIKYLDFSSYCQDDVQPQNSHRLGLLVRNGILVCHN